MTNTLKGTSKPKAAQDNLRPYKDSSNNCLDKTRWKNPQQWTQPPTHLSKKNKKQARSRIEPATKQAQSRNLNNQPMRWKTEVKPTKCATLKPNQGLRTQQTHRCALRTPT